MRLPDLSALTHLSVILANSARAQQHGRYVFCLLQNNIPLYWLKLQIQKIQSQEIQSQEIQSQAHESLLNSFVNEYSIYTAAENEGLQANVLPHQVRSTQHMLPWLFEQLDEDNCVKLSNMQWHPHALLITHGEPIWANQAYTLQLWLELSLNSIQALTNFHRFAIHGDLKAEHFVRYQDRACLIDFERSRGFEQMNRQNTIHATPRYMAPELFHGHALTIQSDYYALGVILLERYLNRRLNAQTYMDWALLHCQSNLLAELVDIPVTDFLRGLLAKNVAERYQNSEDLLLAYQKMSKKIK